MGAPLPRRRHFELIWAGEPAAILLYASFQGLSAVEFSPQREVPGLGPRVGLGVGLEFVLELGLELGLGRGISFRGLRSDLGKQSDFVPLFCFPSFMLNIIAHFLRI